MKYIMLLKKFIGFILFYIKQNLHVGPHVLQLASHLHRRLSNTKPLIHVRHPRLLQDAQLSAH